MRKLIGILLLTLLMMGCSDFGSLNENPNDPADARTDLLLTDAERSVGIYLTDVASLLYVQYFSQVYYTGASRYSATTFDFNRWYANTGGEVTGPLTDLQTIIDLNTDEETADNSNVRAGGGTQNQIAVARILKAYFFQALTDRWGMIPYSEALQGEENQTPVYDSMDAIYADLLNELREAVNQMNGEEGPTGDFMFEGDMSMWKGFANTLRMRMALRLADVDDQVDVDLSQEFTDAYNAGPIEEDMMFAYFASEASDNPWYDRYETRIDFAISKTIADTMKAFEDMRLTQFAADSANTGPHQGSGNHGLDDIEGFPYGLAQSAAGQIGNTTRSLPANRLLEQDASLPVFTMAELHLMLAEAIERGWNVPGTAAQHYESAIQASWEQWGVYDETDFAAYMSEPEVAYDSAKWKQKIGLQKWIALFPQGSESWAEWRRLDYPQLDPAPDAVNNSGEIPVRQAYPTSESEINTENYDAAVEEQGPDGLDTHVWWDIE